MPLIHLSEDGVSGPQTAVALGYNAEHDPAPRVLATGKGVLAEQIIAAARQSGIPIQEDPVLVQALATLDLDQVIPTELYQVVAEVLVYVYRIRQRLQSQAAGE